MINLTIRAHDGHLYKITSRHYKSRPSSARIYRSDPQLTRELISRLPIEPDTWIRALNRTGYPAPTLFSSHSSSIHHAVATAVMRNDLTIYKLPLLNPSSSLRGKDNVGLCVIRGPKPHPENKFHPQEITSRENAQNLLTDLNIEPARLLNYLQSHGLLKNSDCYEDALTLFVTSELLAYKIPLPPPSAPQKTMDVVDAVGAAYGPVPLAPPSNNTSIQKSNPPASQPKVFATSLEEAQQLMIAAGPAVQAAKAQGTSLPQSSYSLDDKLAVIDNGLEERFLVRIMETKYAKDDGYLAQKRGAGHLVVWTAPLSMVVHGDTDAEALLLGFGTRCKPDTEYSIVIIDKEALEECCDIQAIIPTKQNLVDLIEKNPEISNLSPAETIYVLSDELAPKYFKFAKKCAAEKITYRSDLIAMASNQGFDGGEINDLLQRQQLAEDMAAWEEFTGTGMTLDTTKTTTAYGPTEVILLDKKPITLSQLKDNGAIALINCQRTA